MFLWIEMVAHSIVCNLCILLVYNIILLITDLSCLPTIPQCFIQLNRSSMHCLIHKWKLYVKIKTWLPSLLKVTQCGFPMLTQVTCQITPSTTSSDLTTALSLFAGNLVGTSEALRIGSPISTLT